MKVLSPYISLFLILVLCSPAAYTQTESIDSIKKILPTQKEDTDKVTTLLSLSGAYGGFYPDSSLVYAKKALSLAEKLHSDASTFWSLVAINGSLSDLGNYPLELDNAFRLTQIAKKINTPYTIGWSKGLLSDSYYNLGEYNTALKYFRAVVKIAEQTYPDELPGIYNVSSQRFEGMHQYDSALIYAKKSYELFKQKPWLNNENDGSKYARSAVFITLGDAFTGKAYYDSALFYYRLSLPFSEEVHIDINKVNAYNGIAKVYKETSHFDSATWYAKRALHERVIRSYPVGFLKTVNLLAAIYELDKNADSTLKYLHIAINLKDSFFSRERTTAFQSTIFREQEREKEMEAAMLKLQSEYRMYFSVALLIILLTVTAIVIRNKRRKQLQNMCNSIADDLHDDIGSTLTNISILSELSKQHLDSKDNASKFLTRISEEVNTTSQALDDIIWSVNVRNDSVDEIMRRMRRYAGELFDAGGLKYELKFDDSLSGIKLSMDQRRDLYLIFKEAVNNVYKHANASHVTIELNKEEHQLVMRIKDDGNGFETKPSHRNGFKNMQSRAQKWKGHVQIESSLCKGTSVVLFFPFK